MTIRTQIDQVLAQADHVETAWSEALAQEGAEEYGVSDKAFDRDAEDRRELADNAVHVLRELLALAEKGEEIALTRRTVRELIFMIWDGGPEQEEHEVVHRSPLGERYDETRLLNHGTIYTVCPGCLAVDGGIHEVDRAERWNEATVEIQPDTVGTYGVGANGWGRLGSQPNPLAGLPRLSIWADKNADFETDRHECARCGQELLLPDWLESEWP